VTYKSLHDPGAKKLKTLDCSTYSTIGKYLQYSVRYAKCKFLTDVKTT